MVYNHLLTSDYSSAPVVAEPNNTHQIPVNVGRRGLRMCIAAPLIMTGGFLFTISQGYVAEFKA